MTRDVVIVGAGQAGVAAAFKLRAHGYDGSITLLGDEPQLPYHRPPLSKKFIAERLPDERLHIKPADLYARSDITLVSDCEVQAIDRQARQVHASQGRSFPYDALVLATGAQARRPVMAEGVTPSNLLTLRTLADATRMREAFAPGRRLLIIGGGYIGLEAAAVARKHDMAVTLVERGTRILGRVAASETADYFRALHQAQGVVLYEGVDVAHLDCQGDRIVAARLTNGVHLAVDVVVAGIGVTPHTGLAERAELAIDNGVKVDGSCRTSDPSIYALGDCASFTWRGRTTRLESVQNAVDMAEVVACAITGKPSAYAALPWFWSEQYDTRLQIAGLNTGYTRVAVRGAQQASRSIWYFDGDQLIAVDAINDARTFMTAKRLLVQAQTPSWSDVQDVNRPLDALLAA